jgi:hypothetical protein
VYRRKQFKRGERDSEKPQDSRFRPGRYLGPREHLTYEPRTDNPIPARRLRRCVLASGKPITMELPMHLLDPRC